MSNVDVSTRQQLWKTISGDTMQPVEKAAELANTYDMPWSPADKKKPSAMKTVNKTASVVDEADEILKHAFGNRSEDGPAQAGEKSVGPDTNEKDMLEDQPPAAPQAKSLKPRVDVSGQEPPKVVTQKMAQHYALPSHGMYPLDGYDQVEKAASYFNEYGKRMDPGMRREFCQNLVKRASVLGIPVSRTVSDYGADTWASQSTLDFAIDARKSVLLDEQHSALFSKLAESRSVYRLDPELYAETLGELDKLAGLHHHYDRDVPDPFQSTFAKRADLVPHELEAEPDASFVVGNEYMTERQLTEYATHGYKQIEQRFGDELAKALVKSPKDIFESLPRDQKLVLMRMANNSASLQQGASTS